MKVIKVNFVTDKVDQWAYSPRGNFWFQYNVWFGTCKENAAAQWDRSGTKREGDKVCETPRQIQHINTTPYIIERLIDAWFIHLHLCRYVCACGHARPHVRCSRPYIDTSVLKHSLRNLQRLRHTHWYFCAHMCTRKRAQRSALQLWRYHTPPQIMQSPPWMTCFEDLQNVPHEQLTCLRVSKMLWTPALDHVTGLCAGVHLLLCSLHWRSLMIFLLVFQ